MRAVESLHQAFFKGFNPLKEASGKPIYANRIYQHDDQQRNRPCHIKELARSFPDY